MFTLQTDRGKPWRGDIDADVHSWSALGVTDAVCLLCDAEIRALRIPRYKETLRTYSIRLIQFPIIEGAAPEDLPAAFALVDEISDLLENGRMVVMHCRGGVGRAAMIAACVALNLRLVKTAADAISLMRKRRVACMHSLPSFAFQTSAWHLLPCRVAYDVLSASLLLTLEKVQNGRGNTEAGAEILNNHVLLEELCGPNPKHMNKLTRDGTAGRDRSVCGFACSCMPYYASHAAQHCVGVRLQEDFVALFAKQAARTARSPPSISAGNTTGGLTSSGNAEASGNHVPATVPATAWKWLEHIKRHESVQPLPDLAACQSTSCCEPMDSCRPP